MQACASCHRNYGTPYQWEKSPTGKETGRTCVDCHMSEVLRPVAVGGPVKSVKRHLFPGGRSEATGNAPALPAWPASRRANNVAPQAAPRLRAMK